MLKRRSCPVSCEQHLPEKAHSGNTAGHAFTKHMRTLTQTHLCTLNSHRPPEWLTGLHSLASPSLNGLVAFLMLLLQTQNLRHQSLILPDDSMSLVCCLQGAVLPLCVEVLLGSLVNWVCTWQSENHIPFMNNFSKFTSCLRFWFSLQGNENVENVHPTPPPALL